MKGSVAVFFVLMLCLGLYKQFIWTDPEHKPVADAHDRAETLTSNSVAQGPTKLGQEKESLVGIDPANSPEENEALTEEQLALLANPKVQSYLQNQENKKRLQAYFNDEATEESPEHIWNMIEDIEEEGRVIAFEALAMKLAWLEKNSENELDYNDRATVLIDQYKKNAKAAADAYDPHSIPGFTQYKEAELRIIKEVDTMQTYPDNLSKQEYLRKRLHEARIIAYGS